MDDLSDEQLWNVANTPLPDEIDSRLRELTTLGKTRDLSPEEQIEIETHLKEYNRYVLQRSKALLILKQRGHSLEGFSDK